MKRRSGIFPAVVVSLLALGAPAFGKLAVPPKGHPVVTLDRLDLSAAPLAAGEEKYLRAMLVKEARLADWGAGRGAHIEFRLRIDEFDEVEEGGVLHVECNATGWLPRGRIAKSHLAFGGAAKDRTQLVERVLAIMARGVVTRLADLERRRRGS